MQITIPVVTRLQDNGDGGYTMYVHNDRDELIASMEESAGEDFDEAKKKEILGGNDEYENGYIEDDTITVEVQEDGTARLVGEISFHAGQ